MSTQLPSQEEQPSKSIPPVAGSPQPSAETRRVVLPTQTGPEPQEETFYFEEEQPDLNHAFVAPFQLSGALPGIPPQAAPASQDLQQTPTPAAPAKQPGRKPRLSMTMIAIIVCAVVIVGLVVFNALGQATPALQTRGGAPSPTGQQGPAAPGNPPPQATSTQRSVPSPTSQNGGGQGQGQGQVASNWVPQQLPDGWTNAGLSTGDGIQAIRTAVAFNDREMSLDFRSVGTRNNHGGTFTAATFVMTPAARQRFQQNDVRESSNALFDTVVNTQQIRLVVGPQPQLVKFAALGQQQFAWVDVAFQYWQSQVDPNNPQQRTGGIELDPATNQPRIHHMMVLLLRVPAANAGNNPAMGGTGWLVSNYGLDLANGTNLDIVQPA